MYSAARQQPHAGNHAGRIGICIERHRRFLFLNAQKGFYCACIEEALFFLMAVPYVHQVMLGDVLAVLIKGVGGFRKYAFPIQPFQEAAEITETVLAGCATYGVNQYLFIQAKGRSHQVHDFISGGGPAL